MKSLIQSPLASYLLLAAALVVWGALLWSSSELVTLASARAQQAADLQLSAEKKAYAARLAVLANDTASDRADLETIIAPDVVTIAKTIEGAGRAAGVDAQVSDASAEGNTIDLPGGGKAQWISFVVGGHGSFSALEQAIALFERLPLASSLDQVDLEKSATSGGAWAMSVRIRVLTSATVSS